MQCTKEKNESIAQEQNNERDEKCRKHQQEHMS